MATYALDTAFPMRRTPHSVRIRLENHWDHKANTVRIRQLETYVRFKLAGHYRMDQGSVAVVFWFSDRDAAFEFKMRWG